jgi:hypothetical protein
LHWTSFHPQSVWWDFAKPIFSDNSRVKSSPAVPDEMFFVIRVRFTVRYTGLRSLPYPAWLPWESFKIFLRFKKGCVEDNGIC